MDLDLERVEVEWAGGDGGGLRKSVLGAAARVAPRAAALHGLVLGCDDGVIGGVRVLAGAGSGDVARSRSAGGGTGLTAVPGVVAGAARRISHTPHYFARLEGGAGLLIDVRPADRVGPKDGRTVGTS